MIFFVISVLVGILLGILLPYNLSPAMLTYVAVGIIAALDSVFGGLVANLKKTFNINVFLTGLISNAILGIFLTAIGNILGISLSFAVIIVFGVRMFNNMATIRRLSFDKYFEKMAREKERKKRLRLEEVTYTSQSGSAPYCEVEEENMQEAEKDDQEAEEKGQETKEKEEK